MIYYIEEYHRPLDTDVTEKRVLTAICYRIHFFKGKYLSSGQLDKYLKRPWPTRHNMVVNIYHTYRTKK